MNLNPSLVGHLALAALLGAGPVAWTTWKTEACGDWRAMDLRDLSVRPSTALDFSFQVEPGEAGQHGFARINERGDIVFAQKPDQPLRFFYASQIESLTTTDQVDVEAVAEQIRLAGYNAVRAHFLDQMLMKGSPRNLVFNPTMLKRWDQFTAALKKRGIYLCIDASTSWAAFNHPPHGKSAILRGAVGIRLYYDDQARAHWSEGVRLLLEHVNPYLPIRGEDQPVQGVVAVEPLTHSREVAVSVMRRQEFAQAGVFA